MTNQEEKRFNRSLYGNIDLYWEMLVETAVTHNWPYLDLWNSIPPAEFTDTPVHLTPDGTKLLAETVVGEILKIDD